VTQIETPLGPERNLLAPGPESCRLLKLKTAILDNEELAKIRHIDRAGFKTVTLPMLFPAGSGGAGLTRAMEALCQQASVAIQQGASFIILSDRGVDANQMPIPALLATAGVHHHLVRAGTRVKVGLIVESGEPREVHHVALLLGYGAGAVNPYLAFETLDDMIREQLLAGVDAAGAVKNYLKALNKGVVKVTSKMGISTIQSYRGAQIFEAIGLDRAFVDEYFTWTASRVGGIGIDVVAQETSLRHHHAHPDRPAGHADLDWGGQYQWRRDGEYHMLNPETVAKLQHAARANSYALFKEFSKSCDAAAGHLATLRGLMDLKYAEKPILIDEVEPVENIV
ncbi:MAG: glutamate synthase central domain-containing protein, partial [Pseudomonadota bacterium]